MAVPAMVAWRGGEQGGYVSVRARAFGTDWPYNMDAYRRRKAEAMPDEQRRALDAVARMAGPDVAASTVDVLPPAPYTGPPLFIEVPDA